MKKNIFFALGILVVIFMIPQNGIQPVQAVDQPEYFSIDTPPELTEYDEIYPTQRDGYQEFSESDTRLDLPDEPNLPVDTFQSATTNSTTSAFTSCNSVVDIPEAECLVLVDFYNATGGPSWNDNTNWLATDDVCSWKGIGCFDNHVTQINLPMNGLAGVISTDFKNLTNLTWFQLWYDYGLSGDLTTIVGNMPTSIETLNLNGNNITGSVPAAISGLTNLRSFRVGGNAITGDLSTAIGYLPTGLEKIDYGDNEFTGTVPASISSFTFLEDLDVGWNDGVTGDVDVIIGNLPSSIVYVRMDFCFFAGTIPASIYSLTKLEELYLQYNWGIEGDLETTVNNLPSSIRKLDISNNNISGTVPASIASLSNLEFLNLRGNSLTGDFGTILGYLPTSWTSISFGYNNFTGTIPPAIANFTNLSNLDVEHNLLTGDLTSIIGTIPYSNLKNLRLGGNNFTGTITADISNFNQLSWLDVSESGLVGDFSTIIGYLPTGILHLFLQGNAFAGTIPASISNLSNLFRFDISKNLGLNGTIPIEITALSLSLFDFSNTLLCEPADPTYDTWKSGISSYYPGLCGLPPMTNDNIADAIEITSLPYSYSGHNVGATIEAGEPDYACGYDVGNTVWFEFTPTADGLFLIHTNGSAFDTVLHVFESSGGWPVSGCSDYDLYDYPPTSRLTFHGQTGVKYLISIGGNWDDVGLLSVSMDEVCSDPNSLCVVPRYPWGEQAFYTSQFYPVEIRGSDGSYVFYTNTIVNDTYVEFIGVPPSTDYIVSTGADGLYIIEENVTAPGHLIANIEAPVYINIETKDVGGKVLDSSAVNFTTGTMTTHVGFTYQGSLGIWSSPGDVHIDIFNWDASYYFYEPNHTLADKETISLDASILTYETMEMNLDSLSDVMVVPLSPTSSKGPGFQMIDGDVATIVAPLDNLGFRGFYSFSIQDSGQEWSYRFDLPNVTINTHLENNIVDMGGTLSATAQISQTSYVIGESGVLSAKVFDGYGNQANHISYFEEVSPDFNSTGQSFDKIYEITPEGEIQEIRLTVENDLQRDTLSSNMSRVRIALPDWVYTKVEPVYELYDALANPVAGSEYGSYPFKSLQFSAEGPTGTWQGGFSIDTGPIQGTIGDSIQFLVNAGPPKEKAILIAPTGSITQQSPTYSWNEVSDATWYLLVVKKDGTQVVTWLWKSAASICSGGTCTVTPGKLLGAGNYSWWVMGKNDAGNGPWSLPGNFTIEGKPDRPALYAPELTIFDQTPTYSWEDVYSAEFYLLVVKKDGTEVVTWLWKNQADICTGGFCEVDPGKKLGAGHYTFWVVARNSAGFGFWSLPGTYTLEGTPDQPALYYPTGTIPESAPEFDWQHVYSATQYVLVVRDSGNNVEVWTTYNAADICSVDFCGVVPAGLALPDDSYTWQVLPKNGYGNGFWSLTESFTVNTP